MDIEELKKYSENKIEADDLTKQVRQRIKETIWDKQNKREGFSESFKPLISQFKPLISKFEKPEDPEEENIFTQNQKIIKNQLALTEGLKENQKANTERFSQVKRLIDAQDRISQFEREADMKDLPGVEAIEDEDDQAQTPIAKKDKPPIAKFNVEEFNNNLNNKESQDLIKNNGYDYLPSYYFDKNVSEIFSLINSVNSDLKDAKKDIHNTAEINYIDGYEIARPKSKNPQAKTVNNIKNFNTLSIYSANLNHLRLYKEKVGSGMFYNNPEELLHRLELLRGSLAAGNNGVLPEFIQIAHRLRDLGIITSNQLNKLLRKVI